MTLIQIISLIYIITLPIFISIDIIYYKNSNMLPLYASYHNMVMRSDRNGHYSFNISLRPILDSTVYQYENFLKDNRYVQPPADVLRAISDQGGVSYDRSLENNNRRRERFSNTERERLAIEREASERQMRERATRDERENREREARRIKIIERGYKSNSNSNNNNSSPPAYSLKAPPRTAINNNANNNNIPNEELQDRVNLIRYESSARGQLVPFGPTQSPDYEHPPRYEPPKSLRHSMPLAPPPPRKTKLAKSRRPLRNSRNSRQNRNENENEISEI